MTSSFELVLGMPHLGRNNLSESILFKEIGHHRWKTIEELARTPSSEWRDGQGARLYATFYFVEIRCQREKPLSSYGENHVLRFESDLAHYGKTQLDGHYHLVGEGGMFLRACNVFVVQDDGPSKLRITPPQNLDYSQIQSLAAQPDARQMCRRARESGAFFEPEDGDVPLFERRAYRYQIDPDRDLNGAGLVYFANFIAFLDQAERRVLGEGSSALPPAILDLRSTHRRMIGYYGNARSSDALTIELRARARLVDGRPGERLLDLGLDYTVTRVSDDRLIVVSSARKVAPLAAGSDDEARVVAILSARRNGR